LHLLQFDKSLLKPPDPMGDGLENVQIGYTFPMNFLDKIGADVWRFYISAENVYTLTNYSGADPEIGAMSSFDIGIDRGVYPLARTFRLGTSITF